MRFDEADNHANHSDEMSEYNPALAQSHTSFKSALSGATVLTQNQKELNKMIKQTITTDADLDEYMEKLLDVQRVKNKKLEKQF